MSINQHQFEQLTEMGISLWQRRTNNTQENGQDDTTLTSSTKYVDIDLNNLAKQPLFIDILFAIGLSIGEISHQGNHLNVGLFNWYFSSDITQANTQTKSEANSKEEKIHWHEQQLTTPPITELSTSPMLKKQLWQILSTQAL